MSIFSLEETSSSNALPQGCASESIPIPLNFELEIEANLIAWKNPESSYRKILPGIPESVWTDSEKVVFPSHLDSNQRAIVHKIALRLNLFHTSLGSGIDRRVVIFREKPGSVSKASLGKSCFQHAVHHPDRDKVASGESSGESFEEDLCTRLLMWYLPKDGQIVKEVRGIPSYCWSDQEKVVFPSTLTSWQRVVIHNTAMQLNLHHISKGSKTTRHVTVYRSMPDETSADDIENSFGQKVEGVADENAVQSQVQLSGARDLKSINWLDAQKFSTLSPCQKPRVVPLIASLTGEDKIRRLKLIEGISNETFGLHPGAEITIMQDAVGLLDTAGVGTNSSPVQLVDSEELLSLALSVLATCSEVAFDAEMHSYHSYFGITCTLQLCGRHRGSSGPFAKPTTPVYVLDCIALWSVLPHALSKILSDPSILKIGFAIAGDVLSLYRDFGLVFVNAVCLQIAAELAGDGSNIGLAKMLSNAGCPVTLIDIIRDGKDTLRNLDWRSRPLTVEMLEYSAGDVLHLIPAFHVLMNKLMLSSQESSLIAPDPPTEIDNPIMIDGSEGAIYNIYNAPSLQDQKCRLIQESLARTQKLCIEKSVYTVPKSPEVKATEWAKEKKYKELLRLKEFIAKQKKTTAGSGEAQETPVLNQVLICPWTELNNTVLSRLYEWREFKAVELDESPVFVACVEMILWQAEKLPQEESDVIRVLQDERNSSWCQTLEEEKIIFLARELLDIQERALEQGREKIRLEEERQRCCIEEETRERMRTTQKCHQNDLEHFLSGFDEILLNKLPQRSDLLMDQSD